MLGGKRGAGCGDEKRHETGEEMAEVVSGLGEEAQSSNCVGDGGSAAVRGV
jgi:hypothetical protein